MNVVSLALLLQLPIEPLHRPLQLAVSGRCSVHIFGPKDVLKGLVDDTPSPTQSVRTDLCFFLDCISTRLIVRLVMAHRALLLHGDDNRVLDVVVQNSGKVLSPPHQGPGPALPADVYVD